MALAALVGSVHLPSDSYGKYVVHPATTRAMCRKSGVRIQVVRFRSFGILASCGGGRCGQEVGEDLVGLGVLGSGLCCDWALWQL